MKLIPGTIITTPAVTIRIIGDKYPDKIGVEYTIAGRRIQTIRGTVMEISAEIDRLLRN